MKHEKEKKATEQRRFESESCETVQKLVQVYFKCFPICSVCVLLVLCLLLIESKQYYVVLQYQILVSLLSSCGR